MEQNTATLQDLQDQILKALAGDPESLQELDEYLIELHTAYHRHEELDEEKRVAYFYHFLYLRRLLKLFKDREQLRVEERRTAA